MDANETIKYLYENGHIVSHEHYETICAELTSAIENPDVQRLIKQAAKQIERDCNPLHCRDRAMHHPISPKTLMSQ